MSYQDAEHDYLLSYFWNSDKPLQNDIDLGSKSADCYDSINSRSTAGSQNNVTDNYFANPFQTIEEPLKKKTFNIRKYVKYDQAASEFCEDGDFSEHIVKKVKPGGKCIKFIKNNFKKMTSQEKLNKLQTLSDIVRRYRRKIKNIRKKIKAKAEKIWSKYLKKKLIKGKRRQGKRKENHVTVTIKNIILALKKIRHHPFEFEKDRYLIENLINYIESGRLTPESINYKIIGTQIRAFLEKKEILHLLSGPMTYINFEKQFYITKQELVFYNKAASDEDAFRAILGCKQEDKQNVKGIYDQVLATDLNNNKLPINADEFCNNMFNPDYSLSSIFIK